MAWGRLISNIGSLACRILNTASSNYPGRAPLVVGLLDNCPYSVTGLLMMPLFNRLTLIISLCEDGGRRPKEPRKYLIPVVVLVVVVVVLRTTRPGCNQHGQCSFNSCTTGSLGPLVSFNTSLTFRQGKKTARQAPGKKR